MFYFEDNGEESIVYINCPSGFFTPFVDFSNQTVSNLNLETITECSFLKISHSNFNLLLNESLAWKTYAWSILEESSSYNETRVKLLTSLSAEERYLQLMRISS